MSAHHIDMNQEIQDLLAARQKDIAWRAIVEGDTQALAKLQRQGSVQATIDLRKETPIGQRQVESLLRFMVSPETERAMEDAEGDNKVYDALGEHRILGRAKKKKKKSRVVKY